MVINPKILERIDKFDAPDKIKTALKYALNFQDRSELENLPQKSLVQKYEKLIEEIASDKDIIKYCEKYESHK